MGSAPSKWVALPEEPPGLKPMSLLLPQMDNNNTNKMKKNTTKYFICEGCGKKCATRRARLAHRKFCDEYIIWKDKTIKWKKAVDATKQMRLCGTPRSFILILLIESDYFSDNKVIQISKMHNHEIQTTCSNWLLSYRGKRLFSKKKAQAFRIFLNSGFINGYKNDDKTALSILLTNKFWYKYAGPRLLNICNIPPAVVNRIPQSYAYKRFHWFDTIEYTTISEIDDNDMLKIIINAPNIQNLNLGWCTNLNPISFQRCLWHFDKLQTIDIRGCRFSNKLCFQIGNCCPALTSLNLSGATYLKDFVIKNIAKKCIHLIELRLSGCEQLTKLSIEYLTLNEHLNLYEFDISWINNIVGVQTCRRIGSKFKRLSGLTLSHTTIGDEALLYFYRCTDLISLDISYSPKLHDDVVAELLPEFKLLNELNLEGCFDLGHHTVEAIIQNCKMIEVLNISMLEKIDDDLIDKIAIQMKDLKELYVDHCSQITDKSLKHLVRESKETLRLLSISCNSNVTNNGLIYFSNNLNKLNTLNLTACTQVDDNLIYQFEWDNIQILEEEEENNNILIDVEMKANSSPHHHHQAINEIGKGLIFNKTLTNLNIVRTAISKKAIHAMKRRKNIDVCKIEF